MSMSHQLFHGLAQRIVLERNQGIDFEARRMLPPGWKLECRDDGYIFTGPWSDEWEDAVWRLVRYLSYKSILALSRSGDSDRIEYELVTCMEHGTGFRAVFRRDEHVPSG